MRSRTLVVWAMGAILLALCLAMVCQVRSCARRMGIGPLGPIGRIADGLMGTASYPTSNQTEPQKPSIVPPGHSARPSASRRPVFGTPSTEGTEVRILPQRHKDTTRLLIRKDGSVQNIGKETLSVRVTRYGPPWVEWDPSVGVCGLVRVEGRGAGDEGGWKTLKWKGYSIDFGVKVKLVDFRPGRVVQIGVPVVYATTAGPGIGADFRVTGMEWVALDAGYFPMVKRTAVGISLNWP